MDADDHSGVSSAAYAAQSLKQELAGFDCAICMQLFSDPRVLPCGHSFCTQCIKMLISGPAPFKCALCKRVFSVADNDATKLPRNYALISASGSSNFPSTTVSEREVKVVVKCSEHEHETAQLYCQDCNSRVCTLCIDARLHLRHALISVQQQYAEQIKVIVELRERAKSGAQLLEQYSRERRTIMEDTRADMNKLRAYVNEIIHSGISALMHLQTRIDSEIQSTAYDIELHLENINRKFGDRASEMMATLAISKSEQDVTGWLDQAERLRSRVEEMERCIAGPLMLPPGIQLDQQFEQEILRFRHMADSLRELLFKRQSTIYRKGERDGVIFMIGGTDKSGLSDQVRLFNPYKRAWVTISACLNEKRERAAAATLNNRVYVSGGKTTTSCLNSVEMYDTELGNWTTIASMCCSRYGHSLVSFNDNLYAIGGHDDNGALDSVEKYNLESNTWTLVTPMNMARAEMAGAAFKNRMISIGGCNGDTIIESCEALDQETNQWDFIAPLNFSRSHAAAAVWCERLFVFGGISASGSFEVFIEEYNATDNKWSAFEETLESRLRVGFGVAATPACIFIVGGQKDVARLHRNDWLYYPGLRRIVPSKAKSPKCNNVAVTFCAVNFQEIMLKTSEQIVPASSEDKSIEFSAW